MADIEGAVNTEGTLIIQAGTGSGKTVCALSALIPFCLDNGYKLIYTTRTNSQQEQVFKEAKEIFSRIRESSTRCDERDARISQRLIIPLQGRTNMCLLCKRGLVSEDVLPDEISLLCNSKKKKTAALLEKDLAQISHRGPLSNREVGSNGGLSLLVHSEYENEIAGEKKTWECSQEYCPFYYNLLKDGSEPLKEWMEENIPSAGSMLEKCYSLGICPYELGKELLKESLMAVMPYVFVFNDNIRHHLLDWMNTTPGRMILVVDEAHNLPNQLREMYSFSLSEITVKRSLHELEELADGEGFLGGQKSDIQELLNTVLGKMTALAEDYIHDYLGSSDIRGKKGPLTDRAPYMSGNSIADFGSQKEGVQPGSQTSNKNEKHMSSFVTLNDYISDEKDAVQINNEDIDDDVSYFWKEKVSSDTFFDPVRDHAVKSFMNDSIKAVGARDGILPHNDLLHGVMSELGCTSTALVKTLASCQSLGRYIISVKNDMNEVPRSYLLMVSDFLLNWFNIEEDEFIKLVRSDTSIHLDAFCLDPCNGGIISEDFLASVHMSGTLEPIDEYIKTLQLKAPSVAVYPSPFPPSNLMKIYSSNLTTKFSRFFRDEKMFKLYIDTLESILASHNGNTIIFFPSYRLLGLFQKVLEGTAHVLRRPLFSESNPASRSALIDEIIQFKDSNGGIFLSVMGGRMSEGMDFPGNLLEMVILVGLPFPSPNSRQKALKFYYDVKMNDGWLIAVTAPTVRKTLQTIGRLIRDEQDRGAAVILDYRVKRFKNLLGEFRECRNITGEIKNFFGAN